MRFQTSHWGNGRYRYGGGCDAAGENAGKQERGLTTPMVNLLQAASPGPVIGIDVGEDFLDLAIVDDAAKHLRLARVAVAGIERDTNGGDGRIGGAIPELRRRTLLAAPELSMNGAIALVDSPRSPRDVDLAEGSGEVRWIAGTSGGRAIDLALRELVGRLGLRKAGGGPFSLSLFPTPQIRYFAACVRDSRRCGSWAPF